MQLTVMISLDSSDASQRGPDAVSGYLRDVASRIQSGYGTGNVHDLNGNTIGRFEIIDEPGPDHAMRMSAALAGDYPDGSGC